MYELDDAINGDGKFQETMVALDGKLQYVSYWGAEGKCHGLEFSEDGRVENELALRYETVDFSPRLNTGYYNLDTQSYWLSMNGHRQYKVGLNSECVSARRPELAKLGEVLHPNTHTIRNAYNGGQHYPVDLDGLSALAAGGRDLLGISPHYGIHRTWMQRSVICMDSSLVVGVYDLNEHIAYTQEGLDVRLPPYMKVEQRDTPRLFKLLQK